MFVKTASLFVRQFREGHTYLYLYVGLFAACVVGLGVLAYRGLSDRRDASDPWYLGPLAVFLVTGWVVSRESLRVAEAFIAGELDYIYFPPVVGIFGGLTVALVAVLAAWGLGISWVTDTDDGEWSYGGPAAIGSANIVVLLVVVLWQTALRSSTDVQFDEFLVPVGAVVLASFGPALIAGRRSSTRREEGMQYAIASAVLLALAAAGSALLYYFFALEEFHVGLMGQVSTLDRASAGTAREAVAVYSAWTGGWAAALASVCGGVTIVTKRKGWNAAAGVRAAAAAAGLAAAAALAAYGVIQTQCFPYWASMVS